MALTNRRRGVPAGIMAAGAQVLQLLILAIAAIFRQKALLVAENLCLRQQLIVLRRRHPRPRLRDADRRFWILASRWFSDWRQPLLIVKPETVLGWQRAGWRAYWKWRSSRKASGDRPAIQGELQALIGRMAAENRLWGQKRIQAELARLGFQVSARTVAKYMRGCRPRGPTGMAAVPDAACTEHVGLRFFLCPDGLVPNASRLLRHPAREQGGPPRCRDAASDGGLGRAASRRMLRLGSSATAILDSRSRQPLRCELRSSPAGSRIRQVRTPFRSPRANAVAERWVRSARSECLDHLIVFSEANLRRISIRVRQLL
jgi:putative transposase